MPHKLSSAAAALLIGASAATGLGVHVSHAASTSKQTHFADALLWPYQGNSNSNGGNGNGGSTNVLWQNSNIPGGSFAILTGQGGDLNFILHAKYLQPNQNYTAYIGNGACGNTSGSGASSGNGGVAGGNGNSSGNGSTALANYRLGKQKSSAGGAITVVGKLDLTKLPTSFATGTSGSGGSNSGGSNGNSSGWQRIQHYIVLGAC